MTDAAAFQACFTDWRLVKGRKCVQVVLELPLEHADRAYQALGGMPDPGKSVWCAVARLESEVMQHNAEHGTKHKTKSDPVAPTPGRADRRPFTSLPLPQQAALLCNDPIFWTYVNEEWGYAKPTNADEAAEHLRFRCGGIRSRSELTSDKDAAEIFIADREHFMAWKLVG